MRYVVPQFIDVEDKILGPITARQFAILLGTSFVGFITYKLADFALFVLLVIIEAMVGGVFAFLRVNGQPFHYFVLNVVQTMQRPGLRVWDKQYSDAELREILKAPPPAPPKQRIRKEPLGVTRLGELSLTVNTGGVYNPEE